MQVASGRAFVYLLLTNHIFSRSCSIKDMLRKGPIEESIVRRYSWQVPAHHTLHMREMETI